MFCVESERMEVSLVAAMIGPSIKVCILDIYKQMLILCGELEKDTG